MNLNLAPNGFRSYSGQDSNDFAILIDDATIIFDADKAVDPSSESTITSVAFSGQGMNGEFLILDEPLVVNFTGKSSSYLASTSSSPVSSSDASSVESGWAERNASAKEEYSDAFPTSEALGNEFGVSSVEIAVNETDYRAQTEEGEVPHMHQVVKQRTQPALGQSGHSKPVLVRKTNSKMSVYEQQSCHASPRLTMRRQLTCDLTTPPKAPDELPETPSSLLSTPPMSPQDHGGQTGRKCTWRAQQQLLVALAADDGGSVAGGRRERIENLSAALEVARLLCDHTTPELTAMCDVAARDLKRRERIAMESAGWDVWMNTFISC
jgi:hypothetical protein